MLAVLYPVANLQQGFTCGQFTTNGPLAWLWQPGWPLSSSAAISSLRPASGCRGSKISAFVSTSVTLAGNLHSISDLLAKLFFFYFYFFYISTFMHLAETWMKVRHLLTNVHMWGWCWYISVQKVFIFFKSLSRNSCSQPEKQNIYLSRGNQKNLNTT